MMFLVHSCRMVVSGYSQHQSNEYHILTNPPRNTDELKGIPLRRPSAL